MVNEQKIVYTEFSRRELKWWSVSLSEIVAVGSRLEASVFNSQGRHVRAVVSSCKWKSVPLCDKDGFAVACIGGRFKRRWLKKSDLPIYQPSSMADVYPLPDGYLSKNTRTNLETLRVHKGQILLSCSGTIGKVCYVSKTLDNQIFSHDLIRLNVNIPMDIGYIYAFLRSSVGNMLLQTNNYGAVVKHIEPEHLSGILVPNPPDKIKEKINDLIIRSFELRDESNESIDNATAMLIKELKLPPIDGFQVEQFDNGADVNAYSVKLSELAGRIDGSYHLPIIKAITKHLCANASEVTTIGDKRVSKDIILAGIFKRIYVEEGYGIPFLGGKEISQLTPKTEKYLSRVYHTKRYEKELKVGEHNILVTDRGTIGIVAFVPKHWESYAVSQNVLKLIPANNEIAGYLFIFLNSEYGKMLVRWQTYGSVVNMIDNNSLSVVPFPILKNVKAQAEINRLALYANELRYQAYLLEREAMSVLENDVFKS
ncbi:MAG: restriction endonuclease subunit S [Chitinispirillales bacterium]|nr:restriction endonuclease subunit S [Chitinispirillales bacterium]